MTGFGSSENNVEPPLCANNCGFYGTPKNQNLCSVCYAAFLKRKMISNSSETGEDSQQLENDVDDVFKLKDLCRDFVKTHVQQSDRVMKPSSPSASKSSVTSESIGGANASAKTQNRCVFCNKKVRLLGFNCQCGGLFCGKHRHPEEHSCGVDRNAIGKQILAKQFVECKGDKLEYRI